MDAFKLLQLNNQALNFIPVGVKEVIIQGISPIQVFVLEEGRFVPLFEEKETISREKILKLMIAGTTQVFVNQKDYPLLKQGLEELLRKYGRSLSIGKGPENARRLINLLAVHLAMVFREPTHDETLNLHYQAVRTLAMFLLDNKKLISDLFFTIEKLNHYYVYSQPISSSLLFLGILQFTQVFSAREMEVLFIASYFKDLGLALVPSGLLEAPELAPQEKQIMANHSKGSAKILQGRIPLAQNYLTMIENHHIHSLLDKTTEVGGDSLLGIETLFMSMSDMLTAMCNQRPYRDKMDLFSSLSYLKNLVCGDYPQEFKAMVQYIQRLHSDRSLPVKNQNKKSA